MAAARLSHRRLIIGALAIALAAIIAGLVAMRLLAIPEQLESDAHPKMIAETVSTPLQDSINRMDHILCVGLSEMWTALEFGAAKMGNANTGLLLI